MSAIFLYSLLGSPTPDHPSVVEAVILLLFILALGLKGLYQPVFNFSVLKKRPKWEFSVFILFLYGLSVPVLSALYHGVAISIFLRDMVGFIFLCLPLFLMPFLLENKKRQGPLLVGLLFIGIAFSVRVLFLDFSLLSKREELLYLANSPLVLFGALYFSVMAFDKMRSAVNFQNSIIVMACILLAILPLAAMYIDFQRASFLALGGSICMLLGFRFVKTPLYTFRPIIILGLMAFLFSAQIMDIIENISVKTSQVGLNMRVQEFGAVWDVSRGNVFALFLGQGWGANFASPAVGGLNVSYTHSLITYMLLKTGLVGLGLTLIYLFFIFEKVARLVFIEPVKGSALIWPFIIPILLYASYKSLDYGLVLVLILVAKAQIENAARDKIK